VYFKNSLFYQVVLIFLIIFGVYYPSIFTPFNTIDDLKMIDNLLNMDGFSIKQILLPNSYGQYYRPLLYLTFIADKYIWGLEASFMHLENILMHLGNTLLVFWLTRQIISLLSGIKSYPYAPFVTALLFGLHPIATEPVNWVSGRTDLMAGFFVLLAFGLFLVGAKQGSSASPAFDLCDDSGGVNSRAKQVSLLLRPYGVGLFGALSLLAGCLSKETALFILPVILAWCVFPPKESKNNLPVRLRVYLFTVYSCAGAFYLLLRWLALSGGDKIVKTIVKVGNAATPETAVSAVDVARVVTKTAGFYFKKLIIPVPLNFGINGISPHYLWLGLLVLCVVVWCMYKRDTISYLFFAAFMLTSSAFLLPILKITWTPIAERYVYMASAPFLIGVTVLYIKYIIERISARVTTLVVALVLGSAAIVTAQRNIIWQDNFTLFEDTMKKSPDFGAIKNEYAVALRALGRIEEADKIMLSNLVGEFQPSSLNNIRVMVNQGKLEEARTMLLERLKKPSEYDSLSYELLLQIDEIRREKTTTEAEKQKIDRDILSDLLKLETITGNPFIHYRLGTIYLRLADKKSAKASFEIAYQNSPKNSHYHEAAKKLADRL
jgi:hypothetical protein